MTKAMINLVPMPGFFRVGGYGGRGYPFALCRQWMPDVQKPWTNTLVTPSGSALLNDPVVRAERKNRPLLRLIKRVPPPSSFLNQGAGTSIVTKSSVSDSIGIGCNRTSFSWASPDPLAARSASLAARAASSATRAASSATRAARSAKLSIESSAAAESNLGKELRKISRFSISTMIGKSSNVASSIGKHRKYLGFASASQETATRLKAKIVIPNFRIRSRPVLPWGYLL